MRWVIVGAGGFLGGLSAFLGTRPLRRRLRQRNPDYAKHSALIRLLVYTDAAVLLIFIVAFPHDVWLVIAGWIAFSYTAILIYVFRVRRSRRNPPSAETTGA